MTTTLSYQKPRLTVMLGPPSSGKTALMRHVVEQSDHNDPLFRPIRIDLRLVDISAQESLYSSILEQVSGPQWRLFDKSDSFEIKTPGDATVSTRLNQALPSTLIQLLKKS